MFLFFQTDHTGSWAYPPCTRATYPKVQRQRLETYNSLPRSDEVTNTWKYTSTSPYTFMVS